MSVLLEMGMLVSFGGSLVASFRLEKTRSVAILGLLWPLRCAVVAFE